MIATPISMGTAQSMMSSPIGTLYLAASEKGLRGIYWKRQPAPLTRTLRPTSPEIKVLAMAHQQLEEYFKGQRERFDLPLDLQGTDFQKRVWRELLKIPYGKTISYSELARRIKNEKAVRAVGTANGKNPLCVIIPCHRVIASDGTLGGYSGGLQIKAQLLQLEQP